MKLMNLLTSNKQDFIQAPKNLSLDELFDMANQIGKLETGGISGREAAAIKLRGCKGDYLIVRSCDYPTLKQNICECISRGKVIVELYK